VSLSLQEFFGDRGTFFRLMPDGFRETVHYAELVVRSLWWSGHARPSAFLILPAAVVLFRHATASGYICATYGWNLRGLLPHNSGSTCVLYAFVFPAVLADGAHQGTFQRIYPF
jgi:hypothetical protein